MKNYDEELGIENDELGKKEEKPLFFNMLLIFSTAGNSLSTLGGFLMYGMAGIYMSMFRMPMMFGRAGMNDELQMAERILRMFKWWSISLIIGSALCLFGLYVMWKSKKSGYLLYVLGQLAPILTYVLFVFLFITGIPIKPFIGILILFSLFPLAFMIMFGIHLKHLK